MIVKKYTSLTLKTGAQNCQTPSLRQTSGKNPDPPYLPRFGMFSNQTLGA